MARRFPTSSHENPQQLFSRREDPSVLSRRFWARLFQYRPLFLLGVFWLTLICVSAVAYSRLMFSGVPVASSVSAPTAIQRSAPPPVIKPATRRQGASASLAIPQLATIPEVAAADTEAAPLLPNPFNWKVLWELLSLVGLCALGCFLITRQAKRPPRPKKRRKSRPQAAGKRTSTPVALPRPKRLSPYFPARDSVMIPEASGAQGQSLKPLKSPPPSNQDVRERRSSVVPESPNPSRAEYTSTHPIASPSALPPAPSESYDPDIVPDHQDHPLDWPEASIAHTLDLRQRRSLSSFM